MNHCIVPNWNLGHQRQEQVEEEGKTSCDHVPMSSSEVAELTWENGQLALHELDRMVPSPVQVGTGETLECIVDQATLYRLNQNEANFTSLAAPWGGKWPESSSGDMQMKQKEASLSSMTAASGGKLCKSSGHMDTSSSCHARLADLAKKRTRSESEQNCGRYFEEDQRGEASKCASASFCRDTDQSWFCDFQRPRRTPKIGPPKST